jgi:lysophospholipase L1-like esterase
MTRFRQRLFVLGLLLPMVFSLALNYWLVRRARSYERLFNLSRLDPLALARFEPLASLPLDTTRVVLFGDSRAEQWTMPVNPPGVTYVNRGVGGHTSAQTRLRFAAHVASLQPDFVVLQVGTNDLHALNTLPAERERILAAYRAHVVAILADAHALGSTVVLTTVFPASAVPFDGWPITGAEYTAIDDMNDFLLSLASPQTLLLDTRPLLSTTQQRLRPEYAADGWHLNEAGYAALNDALIALISEHLAARE